MRARLGRRLARKVFCTAAAFFLLSVPAAAQTTRFVPQQFPTIQAAIDAARDGDRIEVAAGTYAEHIVWRAKALVLVGAGAAVTTVDGGLSGRCLDLTDVPAAARVEGFTFTRGLARNLLFYESGGALRLTGSSPTIAHNVIRDSRAASGSGILLLNGSDAVLVGNLVTGNVATMNGAGIEVSGSSPLFLANTIDGNTVTAGMGSAGGVWVYGLSPATLPPSGVTVPTFVNNTVTRNAAGDPAGGAGIVFWSSAGRVVNTTVAGNRGGGIAQKAPAKGAVTVVNSILWANAGPNGAAGYDFTAFAGAPYTLGRSIVGPGSSGVGTLREPDAPVTLDPAFVDLAEGDVHLRPSSPAIDGGTTGLPDLPPTDKDGNSRVIGASVDMGAYEMDAHLDSTPPVVTPIVSGTLGRGGWYVSDVRVSWEVADPESPITSTVGCDPATITEDAAAARLTCTAASAGGEASASVEIRRDATPPSLGCAMSPAELWPPDRRLVPVAAHVVADDVNGASVVLRAVASSDPANDAADIHEFEAGSDDRAGLLRAARLGNSTGRTYTFAYEATDPAGNLASCQATVRVPHSQGRKDPGTK